MSAEQEHAEEARALRARVAELEARLRDVRNASGQPLADEYTEAQWVGIYNGKYEAALKLSAATNQRRTERAERAEAERDTLRAQRDAAVEALEPALVSPQWGPDDFRYAIKRALAALLLARGTP